MTSGERLRTRLLPVVLLVLLADCGGIIRNEKPATSTWWLEPYAAVQPGAAADESRLAVEIVVTVVPGLDTARVLALTPDAQLKPFGSARWADSLPELVGSLVGRSLEASGRFDVTARRRHGDARGCRLELEVREFFAVLGAAGEAVAVRVAMSAQYQCGAETPVRTLLSASTAPAGARMPGIVAAYQGALDSVVSELLASVPP